MDIISKAEAAEQKKKRYFTGEPCSKEGHVAERYVRGDRCVTCNTLENQAYRKSPNFKGGRHYSLKHAYGLTVEEVENKIQDQQGLCAICFKPFEDHGVTRHAPNVDHCHATGQIRGILCGHCNKRLSMYHDSVDELQRTIDYLNMFTSEQSELDTV